MRDAGVSPKLHKSPTWSLRVLLHRLAAARDRSSRTVLARNVLPRANFSIAWLYAFGSAGSSRDACTEQLVRRADDAYGTVRRSRACPTRSRRARDPDRHRVDRRRADRSFESA